MTSKTDGHVKDRFRTLGKQRMKAALKFIRLIGNLSNKSSYKYTDHDWQKMIRGLEDEVKKAKSRFQNAKDDNQVEEWDFD